MTKKYNLFDLHCDTVIRLSSHSLSLADNTECHVSLDKAEYLNRYAQVFAVFTPRSMSDGEGYENFIHAVDYFNAELEKYHDRIAPLCKCGDDVRAAIIGGRRAPILAVEDVRILEGNEERIAELHAKGVSFVTPVWGGESCIGGAHNTDIGLTDFGKRAVRLMSEMNIVMDISHSNEKSADDIIEAATSVGGAIIATHSNSDSVFHHSRNLRDRHFEVIKALGGIVGISLCPSHISDEDAPNVDSIVKHIDRYMELGGEDTVAIGADLDGTELPRGFESVSDMYKISDRLSELGYTQNTINKIFFENAYNFAIKNL